MRSWSGRTRRSSSAGAAITPVSRQTAACRSEPFNEFSGSVACCSARRRQRQFVFAVNVARAARNPALEELYYFGNHAGNFAFEIGNPDLAVRTRFRRRRVAARPG